LMMKMKLICILVLQEIRFFFGQRIKMPDPDRASTAYIWNNSFLWLDV
jgi:hypothetical protein